LGATTPISLTPTSWWHWGHSCNTPQSASPVRRRKAVMMMMMMMMMMMIIIIIIIIIIGVEIAQWYTAGLRAG
jgi:hypothetical protein